MRIAKTLACVVALGAMVMFLGGCGDDDGGGGNDAGGNDPETNCTDGVDNDDDGDTDCDDSDCASNAACQTPSETNCTDGVDNDDDGDTDCDDSDCASDAACQTNPLPIGDLYDEWAAVICNNLMDCENLGKHFETLNDCILYLEGQGDLAHLEVVIQAVNQSAVNYDPDVARQCIEDMIALGCDLAHAPSPASCEDMMIGNTGETYNCNIDEECEPGWCDIRNGCPGACTPPRTEGQSCDNGEACDFGLICTPDSMGGDPTCELHPGPLQQGENCIEGAGYDWCAHGLYCEPATEECQPRLGAGEECDPLFHRQCAHNYVCLPDTTDPTTDVCTAYQVIGEGGDCNPNRGLNCDFDNGQQCVYDHDVLDYTVCEVARQEGQACYEQDPVTTEWSYHACDRFDPIWCDWLGTRNCLAKLANGVECGISFLTRPNHYRCLSDHCEDVNGTYECTPRPLECWEEF